jgi:hypothetical protein
MSNDASVAGVGRGGCSTGSLIVSRTRQCRRHVAPLPPLLPRVEWPRVFMLLTIPRADTQKLSTKATT